MNCIEMTAFINKRAKDLFNIFINNELDEDDHESWFSSALMHEGVYTLDIGLWTHSDGEDILASATFKAEYIDVYSDGYNESVSFKVPDFFLDEVLDEARVIEWWKGYQKSSLIQHEWETLDAVLVGISTDRIPVIEKAIAKLKELHKNSSSEFDILPWYDRRQILKEVYGEIPVEYTHNRPNFN